MGAKRNIAAHVDARIQACAGGKKNMVITNHVDRSHWHAEHTGRNSDDRIQAGQRLLAMQAVVGQCLQALGLCVEYGRTLHAR